MPSRKYIIQKIRSEQRKAEQHSEQRIAEQHSEQPITNTNNHPLGLAIFHALNERRYDDIIEYLEDYIDNNLYRKDDEKLRLIKINVTEQNGE